jgi:Peptidase A4 family
MFKNKIRRIGPIAVEPPGGPPLRPDHMSHDPVSADPSAALSTVAASPRSRTDALADDPSLVTLNRKESSKMNARRSTNAGSVGRKSQPTPHQTTRKRGAMMALFVALLGIAATGLGSVSAGASTLSSSFNWAGYVATGETYNYVVGSWTVPTANCGTIFNNFTFASTSATWVGLDGYGSGPVEQIGTDTNCVANQGAYWAWFEMYPHAPVLINVFSNPVSAGDKMDGMVTYAGAPGCYTLRLWDETKHWYYETTQYVAGATGASAEWITEQPNAVGLPLTNFGLVTFTNAYAGSNRSVYPTPISYHPNVALNMVGRDGTWKALTFPLSPDGTSFSTLWLHN